MDRSTDGSEAVCTTEQKGVHVSFDFLTSYFIWNDDVDPDFLLRVGLCVMCNVC
jgi:hypothetical protein